jgi:hypothetical protein
MSKPAGIQKWQAFKTGRLFATPYPQKTIHYKLTSYTLQFKVNNLQRVLSFVPWYEVLDLSIKFCTWVRIYVCGYVARYEVLYLSMEFYTLALMYVPGCEF